MVGPLSLAGVSGDPWALFSKTLSVYLRMFQKGQVWNHRAPSLGPPRAQTKLEGQWDVSCGSAVIASSHTPGHWGFWSSWLLERELHK